MPFNKGRLGGMDNYLEKSATRHTTTRCAGAQFNVSMFVRLGNVDLVRREHSLHFLTLFPHYRLYINSIVVEEALVIGYEMQIAASIAPN